MGFLIGQFAQVIPIPGGIGTIDAGVTGGIVLYGGVTSVSAGGEVISHGISLLVPLLVGSVALALLPGEIERTKAPQATVRTGVIGRSDCVTNPRCVGRRCDFRDGSPS
jgi:hypothetical protein